VNGPSTSKEQATKHLYTKIIKKIFGTPDKRAKELASKLYEQILAHGGNPHNTEDIEITIRVVVGKWLVK